MIVIFCLFILSVPGSGDGASACLSGQHYLSDDGNPLLVHFVQPKSHGN